MFSAQAFSFEWIAPRAVDSIFPPDVFFERLPPLVDFARKLGINGGCRIREDLTGVELRWHP